MDKRSLTIEDAQTSFPPSQQNHQTDNKVLPLVRKFSDGISLGEKIPRPGATCLVGRGTSAEQFPASAEQFPVSAEQFPVCDEQFPVCDEQFPVCDEQFAASAEQFPASDEQLLDLQVQTLYLRLQLGALVDSDGAGDHRPGHAARPAQSCATRQASSTASIKMSSKQQVTVKYTCG